MLFALDHMQLSIDRLGGDDQFDVLNVARLKFVGTIGN